MQYKAIIFDMDGLLVESETVWQFAEEELIAARGHVYTDDVREAIVGLRVDEFLAHLRSHYGFPDTLEALVEELNTRMLTLIPVKVRAQPGALEIIDWAVKNNIPRAIASNSSHAIIETTLASQGWSDIFPIRCSGDDEIQGKPAPYVYLSAARRLGVDPSDCVALEDSPNGSRAAVAAGMTCFAVPDRSHTGPEAFETITPHVFDDLHAVLKVLRG